MASNDDKVDLSHINKDKNPKKLPSIKNPFKKQKGPARDSEGKFSSGSGGLRQLNFSWKRALPIIVVITLVGGFTFYRAMAGRSTGYTHEHLQASSSIGVTKATETRSSKRNARVVEIANGSANTAKAVYSNEVDAGRYEACLLGVAQRGSPRGTFSGRSTASGALPTLGSDDYVTETGADYKKLICIPVNLTGGNKQRVEFTVTNTVPDSTLRVSTIMLEDRDSSHVHEDCRPGQMGMHGPCIDMNTVPKTAEGRSKVEFGTSNFRGGEPGSFRTRCDFSHVNNDDPILYPGRPGEAHLHAFFGNTLTNARSTSKSLKETGNSTCSGGIFNRSAYWAPAMVDKNTGRIIKPNDPRSQYNSDLEIYYKLGYQGVGHGDVQPFPNGLQIIAGNPASATSRNTNTGWHAGDTVKYWCETMNITDRTRRLEGPSIPNCGPNQILTMYIAFPQCWDGKNLSSSNGRSHMAYGVWQAGHDSRTTGCPSTHPIGLPSIEMFIRYATGSAGNANWRLSSDRNTTGPGGFSGHADYIFAWDDTAFPTLVRNCYRPLVDCAYNLGDGREPLWKRDPNTEFIQQR